MPDEELKPRLGLDIGGFRTGLRQATSLGAGASSRLVNLFTAPKLALLGIGAAAVMGMRKASNAFRDFEWKMHEVYTLVDKGRVSYQTLTADVQKFSRTMGFSIEDTTEAWYQAISAGQDAAKMGGFMRTAADLATAGYVDLQTSVDVLTTAINSYGEANLKAERAADILFTTVKLGKTRLAELAGTMGRLLPIAASLGVEMQDLAANIAVTTKAGIFTQISITGLRSLLMGIITPTDDAAKAARQLGVDWTRQGLAAYGLTGLMKQLYEAEQRQPGAIGRIVTEARALTVAMRLASSEGVQELSAALDEMNKTQGRVARSAEEVRKTLEFQKRLMRTEWQNAMIDAGETLQSMDKALIEIQKSAALATQALEWLPPAPFFKLAEKLDEAAKISRSYYRETGQAAILKTKTLLRLAEAHGAVRLELEAAFGTKTISGLQRLQNAYRELTTLFEGRAAAEFTTTKRTRQQINELWEIMVPRLMELGSLGTETAKRWWAWWEVLGRIKDRIQELYDALKQEQDERAARVRDVQTWYENTEAQLYDRLLYYAQNIMPKITDIWQKEWQKRTDAARDAYDEIDRISRARERLRETTRERMLEWSLEGKEPAERAEAYRREARREYERGGRAARGGDLEQAVERLEKAREHLRRAVGAAPAGSEQRQRLIRDYQQISGLIDQVQAAWQRELRTRADAELEAADAMQRNIDQLDAYIQRLQRMIELGIAGFEEVTMRIERLIAAHGRLVGVPQKPLEIIVRTEGAKSALEEIQRCIDNLHGVTIRITVEEFEKPTGKRWGGPVGYQYGGFVARGHYGRDSVPALLERGEYVVNRYAAQAFRPYLEAFNAAGRAGPSVVHEVAKAAVAGSEAGVHLHIDGATMRLTRREIRDIIQPELKRAAMRART